jgi:hypothetical protein
MTLHGLQTVTYLGLIFALLNLQSLSISGGSWQVRQEGGFAPLLQSSVV